MTLVKIRPEDAQTLQRIADRRGITLGQALDLALRYQRFVQDAEDRGDELFIQDAAGNRRPFRREQRS